MADHKAPNQDRKLHYIAPVIIAVIVVGILAVSLTREQFAPPQPVAPTQAPAAPPAPPAKPAIVAAPPVLTRDNLIEAASQAAGQFAAQGKLPASRDNLAGRRFSIRIAFGCGGVLMGNGQAQASSSYDAVKQTVTLTARPGVWTGLPLIQDLGNTADIEAVEGFWIPRPWSSVEGCPPEVFYPVPATSTPPAAQTLGLAQLFTSEASRAARHADHPYEFTRKIAPDDTAVLGHAYWLTLEGRITSYADGGALHCWVESPDHRPVCLYAAAIDRVAFTDGVTGEVLANWRN